MQTLLSLTQKLLNGDIAITEGDGTVIQPDDVSYGVGMGNLEIGLDSNMAPGSYVIEAIILLELKR